MKTTWFSFPMWLLIAVSLAFAPTLKTHAAPDKSRDSGGNSQNQSKDEKKGDDKRDEKKDEKKDEKDDDKDDDGHKVTICHKGHTIEVSKKALKAHLQHGDTRGACEVTPSKNR